MVEHRVEASDPGHDIWGVVAQLSSDSQEVITMRIKGELSFAEISEVLGVPIGTVTSRYSRALAELRRRLPSRKIHEQPRTRRAAP